MADSEPRPVMTNATPDQDVSAGATDTLLVEVDSKQSLSAPNGGYGWVILVASFMLQGISVGLAFSAAGLFYPAWLGAFGAGHAATAWAGAANTGLVFLAGPLASGLSARLGHRAVVVGGAVLAGAGLAAAAAATNIYWLYLTYSVTAGLGFSLIYVPSVVLVGSYFRGRLLAAVLPVAVCGVGVWCLALPPALHALTAALGWRGSLLMAAGIALQAAVFGALLRPLSHNSLGNFKASRRKPRALHHGEVSQEGGSVTLLSVGGGATNGSNAANTTSNTRGLISTCATYEETQLNRSNSDQSARIVSTIIDEHSNYSNSEYTNNNTAAAELKKHSKPLYDETKHVTYHNSTNTLQQTGPPGPPPAPRCHPWRGPGRDSVLRDGRFWALFVNNVLWNAGSIMVIGLVYDYAAGACGVSGRAASWLVGAVGVCGTLGRLATAAACRSHVLALYTAATAVSGLAIGVLPLSCRPAALLAAVCVYGACFGVQLGLLAVLTTRLFGAHRLNDAYGYLMVSNGLGMVSGLPLAGALYDVTGGYDAPFYVGGAVTVLSAAVLLAVPCRRRQRDAEQRHGRQERDMDFENVQKPSIIM